MPWGIVDFSSLLLCHHHRLRRRHRHHHRCPAFFLLLKIIFSLLLRCPLETVILYAATEDVEYKSCIVSVKNEMKQWTIDDNGNASWVFNEDRFSHVLDSLGIALQAFTEDPDEEFPRLLREHGYGEAISVAPMLEVLFEDPFEAQSRMPKQEEAKVDLQEQEEAKVDPQEQEEAKLDAWDDVFDSMTIEAQFPPAEA